MRTRGQGVPGGIDQMELKRGVAGAVSGVFAASAGCGVNSKRLVMLSNGEFVETNSGQSESEAMDSLLQAIHRAEGSGLSLDAIENILTGQDGMPTYSEFRKRHFGK